MANNQPQTSVSFVDNPVLSTVDRSIRNEVVGGCYAPTDLTAYGLEGVTGTRSLRS